MSGDRFPSPRESGCTCSARKKSPFSLSLSLSVWKLLVGGKLVLSNYVPWGRRGNRDPAEILVKINGKKIGGKNERSSSGKIDERRRINNKREGKDGNDGKFIFFSPMLFIIVQVFPLETRVFYRKERKICRASEIISK